MKTTNAIGLENNNAKQLAEKLNDSLERFLFSDRADQPGFNPVIGDTPQKGNKRKRH